MTAKRQRLLVVVTSALAAIPACSAATSSGPAPRGTASSSASVRLGTSVASRPSEVAAASASSACRRLPRIDVDLIEPWADASVAPLLDVPPVASGSAPRPLVDACRSLEAATARGWRTLPRTAQSSLPPRCVGDRAGAWIVVHDAFRRAADDAEMYRGTWSLVFVGTDGRLARGPEATGEITTGRFGFTGSVTILAVHDFDRDGAAEVLIATHARAGVDEWNHHEVKAFQVRDGRVVRWEPMPNMLAWVDVDRDGTPELFGIGPTSSLGLPRVAHAVPSGGFSFDDEVVQAVLRESCPSAPRGSLRTPLQVACAKAWGASRSTIDGWIHAAARGPDCTNAMLAQLASPGPSAMLAGACSVEVPASASVARVPLLPGPCAGR